MPVCQRKTPNESVKVTKVTLVVPPHTHRDENQICNKTNVKKVHGRWAKIVLERGFGVAPDWSRWSLEFAIVLRYVVSRVLTRENTLIRAFVSAPVVAILSLLLTLSGCGHDQTLNSISI